MGEPNISQQDDNSQSASGGGANVRITDSTAKWLIGSFGIVTAASLVAGMLALNNAGNAERDAGYSRAKAEDAKTQADFAERRAELAQYYTIDMETYLFKQGLTPPPDPWRQKLKGHKQ